MSLTSPRGRRLALFVLSLIVSLVVPIAANAIPVASKPADKVVLSLSPLRHELTIKPGRSLTVTATITNLGTGTLDIDSQIQEFKAEGESGKPLLIPSTRSRESLARWIRLSPRLFRIAPSQTITATATIHVPDGAEPGGHYAAVVFGTIPPKSKTTALSARVGLLLLITVPGEIKEAGSVAVSAPLLSEGSSVGLSLRFTNSGNVHVKPTGSVRIRRWMGDDTVAELPASVENVLPRSTRRSDLTWREPSFGIYRVSAELAYGESRRTAQSAPVWLIVAPWRLILAGLGVFVVGVLTPLMIQRLRARVQA